MIFKMDIKTSNQINDLRIYLGLNISQIANIFKVKRVTIYSWINGKNPSRYNQKKLNKLYYFCKIWRSYGINRGLDNCFYQYYGCDKSLIDLLSEDNLNEELIIQIFSKIKDIYLQRKKEEINHEKFLRKHNFKEIPFEKIKRCLNLYIPTIS